MMVRPPKRRQLFRDECGSMLSFVEVTVNPQTVTHIFAGAAALTGLLAGGQPAIRGWTADSIDIQVAAEVELDLPFAGVFQLFVPAAPDAITCHVGDQARWYG